MHHEAHLVVIVVRIILIVYLFVTVLLLLSLFLTFVILIPGARARRPVRIFILAELACLIRILRLPVAAQGSVCFAFGVLWFLRLEKLAYLLCSIIILMCQILCLKIRDFRLRIQLYLRLQLVRRHFLQLVIVILISRVKVAPLILLRIIFDIGSLGHHLIKCRIHLPSVLLFLVQGLLWQLNEHVGHFDHVDVF